MTTMVQRGYKIFDGDGDSPEATLYRIEKRRGYFWTTGAWYTDGVRGRPWDYNWTFWADGEGGVGFSREGMAADPLRFEHVEGADYIRIIYASGLMQLVYNEAAGGPKVSAYEYRIERSEAEGRTVAARQGCPVHEVAV